MSTPPESPENGGRDASPVHTRTVGTGPRVVFVHGALTTSAQTWGKQEPLAERWTLVFVDRRGFVPNPPADGSDAEIDGQDVAPLLADGAHLVGHSYGSLGAMFAAARRPEAVRSLTLIEPPGHSLLRGVPEIEQSIADHAERLRTLPDPADFMRAFLKLLGAPTDSVASPLPPDVERQVRLLMSERPPWECSLPIDTLRAADFPILVVSGDHDPQFERLTDAVAEALGPRVQRAVVRGRGHVVQRTGEPFNDLLEQFMSDAERPASQAGTADAISP